MRPKSHRLLFCVVLLLVVSGCETTTTQDDLVPTPEPPYRWAPFKEAFKHGDANFPALKTADYVNVSPVSAAAAGCATSVVSLDVKTSGKVEGGLSFNTTPRESGNLPETNGGNTDLGPVHKKSGFIQNWGFKFQVVITFKGPLANALYGQMISDPMAAGANAPKFHDDTPANDWVGKTWNVPEGKKKSDFPVVEVQGDTVRWIDAPQGASLKDQKYYVMLYAGACGKVTNVAFLRLDFPDKADPTAKVMTEAQFKADAGNAFTFTDK